MKLPTNLQAESLIITKMLTSFNAVNSVFEKLNHNDFFDPKHISIFKAMYELYQDDISIDPDQVFTKWQQLDEKNADLTYLLGLSYQNIGYSSEVSQFIEIVKETSMHRKLMISFRDNMILSSEQKMSPEAIQSKLNIELDEIFKNLSLNEINLADAYYKDFRDSGLQYLEYVKNKVEMRRLGKNTLEGISTGYEKLDEKIEGLNKGHYIVIGARPGVGKTTFIINLMRNIAVKQNIPIGFFSLEMSCDDFVHNITCQEAKVSSKEVKRGFVKDIDLNNLINAVSRLQNSNIYIDDQSNISIAQLAVRTRRMVQTNNVKVIFIDYLGEITSDIKFPNRQEYMQYISKGVRAIAKNLKIPIVCVAQLNRDSEKANRAPIKADLRESGQIEADAHTIILLHRPDLDDKFDKPGLIQAHIVKNRFGEECRVDFGFEKTTGCILELSNLKYDLEDNF